MWNIGHEKDQSFTALILQPLAHMQIRRLKIHFFIKPLRLFIMGEYMQGQLLDS